MVRGIPAYNPIIHGPMYNRRAWPKGKEGDRQFRIFEKMLTHKVPRGLRGPNAKERRAQRIKEHGDPNVMIEVTPTMQRAWAKHEAKKNPYERAAGRRRVLISDKNNMRDISKYNLWIRNFYMKEYKNLVNGMDEQTNLLRENRAMLKSAKFRTLPETKKKRIKSIIAGGEEYMKYEKPRLKRVLKEIHDAGDDDKAEKNYNTIKRSGYKNSKQTLRMYEKSLKKHLEERERGVVWPVGKKRMDQRIEQEKRDVHNYQGRVKYYEDQLRKMGVLKAKPNKKAPKRKAKKLAIVKQGAVNIRGRKKKSVDNVTVSSLRTRAKKVRKYKCPPGYSKLKKSDLIKWIQKNSK